jgi:hypothetical protein
MHAFEAGFKKYAEECGLSEKKTAHILKRALEHPGTQEMFKQLPTQRDNQSPEDLDALANLMHQDSMDKRYNEVSKKIQLQ